VPFILRSRLPVLLWRPKLFHDDQIVHGSSRNPAWLCTTSARAVRSLCTTKRISNTEWYAIAFLCPTTCNDFYGVSRPSQYNGAPWHAESWLKYPVGSKRSVGNATPSNTFRNQALRCPTRGDLCRSRYRSRIAATPPRSTTTGRNLWRAHRATPTNLPASRSTASISPRALITVLSQESLNSYRERGAVATQYAHFGRLLPGFHIRLSISMRWALVKLCHPINSCAPRTPCNHILLAHQTAGYRRSGSTPDDLLRSGFGSGDDARSCSIDCLDRHEHRSAPEQSLRSMITHPLPSHFSQLGSG